MTEIQNLEKWYQKVKRPLPWRKTRDPYAIWISEVMLQQTQVAVVLPYYDRFMKAFPDIETLANAPVQSVLSLWSGLGYYSRARNLQRGAQYISKLNGKFPKERGALLEVPGIGPYTAGAVLSIAFDLPVPLVDGNVMRVFARFFGWKTPIEKKQSQNFFWAKAKEWVEDAQSPRILNQAVMELGATVCQKAQPQCGRCPLSKTCVAFKTSTQDRFPVRLPRKKSVSKFYLAKVIESKGKYLLRQNPEGSWWHGLWDFPKEEFSDLEQVSQEISGLGKAFKKKLPLQKHTVTHHKLHVVPVLLKGKAKHKDETWVALHEIDSYPLSSLARKVLSSLQS